MAPPNEVEAGDTLDDELHPHLEVRTPPTTLAVSAPTQQSGSVVTRPVSSKSQLMTVARASYEFGDEVARGGLGRILRARDLRLDREVAIKELLRPTPGSEARFLREIEATVKLQHPNIVAIHEAGRWPDGQLFYAMNFVAGKTLLDVLSEAKTLSARLALLTTVIDVAEAVAFAHSEGVVHRDLKPANVLVGRFGETVVIDWGLAKLLNADSDTQRSDTPSFGIAGHTRSGHVVGTPPYMPPEQAAGQEVDRTCDVYALGAILYHVLSGRVPYDDTRPDKLLERIRTEPPTPLGQLEPELPPDLLAIVDKAMSREPRNRYPSGQEMARELQLFARGRLVSAYTYRVRDLLTRFVRRNVAAVVTAAVALLVLLVIASYSIGQVRTERDSARQSESIAKEQLELAERRARELIVARALTLADSDPTAAVASLKQLEHPPHGAASVAARAEESGVARWVLRGHTDSINCVDVSPDGTRLVSGSEDYTLAVWELGSDIPVSLRHHTDRVADCRFSPDGKWMASASYDGHATLWSIPALVPTTLPTHPGAIKSVAFSPDSQYLASASSDDRVGFWRIADHNYADYPAPNVRKPLLDFREQDRLLSGPHHGVMRLWSLDGSYVESPKLDAPLTVARSWDSPTSIVVGSSLGGIFEWDAAAGTISEVARAGATITAISTSTHEPGYAAVATMEGDVLQVDLARRTTRRLMRHQERVLALRVSPFQRFIASGGWDRQVHVFDVTTDDSRHLRGHTDVISELMFTPDENYLITASWDKTVRVWPLRNELHDRRSVLLGHDVGVHSVRFSPDGKWLVSGGHDNTVRLWDLRDKTSKTLRGHTDHVYRAIFSPDGKYIASSSDDRTVRIWSTADATQHRVLEGHEADVEELAYSPDGTTLASASEDHTARIWDTTTGESSVLYHDHSVTGVVYDHSGARLATGSRAGDVRLFDVSSRQEIAHYRDHAGEVYAVSFSPDGRWLASVDKAGALVMRDLNSKLTLRWSSLPGAHGMAYSPDGRWIAVSGATPHLWLCAVPDGACSELRGHESIVRGMRFTPDSKLLVTGGGDGETFVWDVESREYRIFRGHRAPVFDVDVSPDGAWIATGSGDATVRLWPTIPPPAATNLSATLDSLTSETVPDIIPRGPSANRSGPAQSRD